MAEHIGIVIKKESDRYAQVVTDRKGACGGCQSTPHGCRSCLASAKMESRVANPLGAQAGDLVITADIPLAAAVIANGCQALDPRGELYSEDNVRQRLTLRNFMEELRSSGVDTGGPPPLSEKSRSAFANQLYRILLSRCG